ncbi:urokinase plasminogen activator surface receptor-like [Triplophysa dalaica]|uniref:urokinase plasminogen activator surface receptor-like n=1 Tax=Triplophysa dalaica TaxID=1582913 RepID=UPI0024DFC3A7|nr:urokinase plasminogen activator surface receptor-like [Triplophysa dalaica]
MMQIQLWKRICKMLLDLTIIPLAGPAMALQCTILLLISVFLPKALALTCNGCIPDLSTGTCTQTPITCQSLCSSMTTTVYVGGLDQSQSQKICGDPSSCVTGSINYGLTRVTLNSECCRTNYCNINNAAVLPRRPPNGRICFTCDDNGCSKMLPCEGEETQCFTVRVDRNGKKETQKGCSSQFFCGSSAANVSQILGSNEMKCCEGNLCNTNGAKGVQGFFFSLIPLIFLLFI